MMGFYVLSPDNTTVESFLTERHDEDQAEAIVESIRLSIGQCRTGCDWCGNPRSRRLVWVNETGRIIHTVRGVDADIMQQPVFTKNV